jgi:hypothetical protein
LVSSFANQSTFVSVQNLELLDPGHTLIVTVQYRILYDVEFILTSAIDLQNAIIRSRFVATDKVQALPGKQKPESDGKKRSGTNQKATKAYTVRLKEDDALDGSRWDSAPFRHVGPTEKVCPVESLVVST